MPFIVGAARVCLSLGFRFLWRWFVEFGRRAEFWGACNGLGPATACSLFGRRPRRAKLRILLV